VIGNLRADIIINNETVLEFKAIKTLNESAEVQGHNYLRLTGSEDCVSDKFSSGFRIVRLRFVVSHR
jgi:GxxExxY protein